MLEHVLSVLRAYPLEDVVVATDCDAVAALARERGARIAFDAGPNRLGVIVDKSLELFSGSAERALVLMSDLPELGVEDVGALLDAADRADVVLAPDLRGQCTNALLTPLPHSPTRFGHDKSLSLHALDAETAGLRVSLCRRRGLGLDVDEPEDLELLAASGPAQALPGRLGPA